MVNHKSEIRNQINHKSKKNYGKRKQKHYLEQDFENQHYVIDRHCYGFWLTSMCLIMYDG